MNSQVDSTVDSTQPNAVEKARLFVGKAWFWVPIAPFVILDLWSKAAVFAFLQERYSHLPAGAREYPIVESPFGFSFVAWRNRGTIWGLGKDFNFGLIILRFATMALLLWFAAKTPRRSKLQQLVLGLIMAGAIGNLYDNLFEHDRAVRDFLKFFWPNPGGEDAIFPAFNVADSCICVGAITLAILLWREDARES